MPSQLQKYNYCQETIAFKNRVEAGYLVLAKRLYKIKKERLWSENWEYFHQFLSEMNMAEATANKMVNIYQRFILEWQFTDAEVLAAGGWASVSELMPIIRTREDAEDALTQAAVLPTRTALRQYVTEKKTGIPMADCEHEFFTVHECKKCHYRTTVA